MEGLKAYILETGWLAVPKSLTLASAGSDEMEKGPFYSVLIRHPEGCALFDAGCHADKSRQETDIYDNLFMTEENHILNLLAGVGVEPEEIKYIIVSHLHPDHDGYIDLFPNAELFVHEDEFTERVKRYALGDPSAGSFGDIEHWIKSKLKWHLVGRDEKTVEILPGVTILNFGSGHSFGMLGALLNLEKTGKVILTSDALYKKELIGPPLQMPGLVYDKEGFIATVEYILALAKENDAQLWFAHDPELFNSMIKSTQGCYE